MEPKKYPVGRPTFEEAERRRKEKEEYENWLKENPQHQEKKKPKKRGGRQKVPRVECTAPKISAKDYMIVVDFLSQWDKPKIFNHCFSEKSMVTERQNEVIHETMERIENFLKSYYDDQ